MKELNSSLKIFYFLLLALLFFIPAQTLNAQQITFSLPSKIAYGVNEFEILGRSSQGILIQESSRSSSTVEAFSSDMKLKWKKNISLKEVGATVTKIFLIGDSVLVFYSHFVKGQSVLKVVKMNSRFEAAGPAVVLDSTSVTNYIDVPEYSFSVSNDKSKYLVYFSENNTPPKNKIYSTVIDVNLNILQKRVIKMMVTEQPNLLAAVVDDSAKTYFVVGDNQARNFRNNFQFLSIQLYYYSDSLQQMTVTNLYGDGKLMTTPVIRMDWVNQNIIIIGLYADNPGVESQGIYYMSCHTPDGKIVQNKFLKFSDELLSALTGNSPPRRNEGFFNFKAQEMIVKKDGGTIFFAESVSLSTESFSAPGYGGFGSTSSLTVNYYHFDDIIGISFKPDGSIEWQKVLAKKQQTEGDGGYYSSFSTFIGQSSLQLVYNDFISGMVDLSTYKISTEGVTDRTEIFNADRKGILPVCQFGKQISASEMIVPSVKRGYLQFIKLTF